MTIKNFNTNVVLDNTGRWIVNLPTYITNAKYAVVRQLCYVSTNATQAIYKIHSSLSSDLVGTVVNHTLGMISNPQTHIKLNNPTVATIEFWLTSAMLPIASVATDQISIDIDFFSDEDVKLLI